MKVDSKLVKQVAELAQLNLDAASEAEQLHSMSRLLDLLAQLQEADTDGVQPLFHPLDRLQALREDQVTESDQREAFQQLAPATSDGLYLVPRVVE